MIGKTGLPVGKQLKFMSTESIFAKKLHSLFGTCTCVKHSPLGDTDWHETGNTNRLARGIIQAMKSA